MEREENGSLRSTYMVKNSSASWEENFAAALAQLLFETREKMSEMFWFEGAE